MTFHVSDSISYRPVVFCRVFVKIRSFVADRSSTATTIHGECYASVGLLLMITEVFGVERIAGNKNVARLTLKL